ncbi:MAG: FG-GAP repeat protein, partial [Akkermansiaceae bacterium]|nr:FG-GAP repeat protein [Akkermansiaceae bacterium]
MKPCQSFRCLAQSLIGCLIAGTPLIAGQLPGPPDVAGYGTQVAIDGDTAVVGAPGEATALGTYVGAAYVYRRSGDSWVQEAKLTSIAPGASYAFGTSVAIDGNLIAVGAGSSVASISSGSVEFFLRNGTTWQWASLFKPDPAPTYFGRLIAMDNGILAVGDSTANLAAGRVLIYQVNGGSPTGPQFVEASDGAAGDSFGASLALKGSRLVVGAPYHDTDGKADAGAAYLFDVGSLTTFQLAKLKPTDGKASDFFGYAVAVDEQRVLVGAPNQSRGGMIDGAAYLFSPNPG